MGGGIEPHSFRELKRDHLMANLEARPGFIEGHSVWVAVEKVNAPR